LWSVRYIKRNDADWLYFFPPRYIKIYPKNFPTKFYIFYPIAKFTFFKIVKKDAKRDKSLTIMKVHYSFLTRLFG
jgi:hypothetical protein